MHIWDIRYSKTHLLTHQLKEGNHIEFLEFYPSKNHTHSLMSLTQDGYLGIHSLTWIRRKRKKERKIPANENWFFRILSSIWTLVQPPNYRFKWALFIFFWSVITILCSAHIILRRLEVCSPYSNESCLLWRTF